MASSGLREKGLVAGIEWVGELGGDKVTSQVSYIGMQKAEVERGLKYLRSQEIPQTTHRGLRRSHSSRLKLLPSPPLSLLFLIQHRNPHFPVEEEHEENVSGTFTSAPWA